MKSERLTHELTRIRALLEEPKPDLRGAFMAARELLTVGPCVRELAEVKETAMQILERLTLPALNKEREKQLQVSRLIRAIRRAERLDDDTLEPLIAEIAPWIESAADRTGRHEPTPPFPPESIIAALHAIAAWEHGDEEESAPNVVLPSSGNPTPANLQWHDLYRRLGRIITTQHRIRSGWARERKGLTDAVAALGADLVEATATIGRPDGVSASWHHGLSDDLLTRPDAVMETLRDEEHKYWMRVAELEEALTRNQEVVSRFQNLLRRAENALMDSRDATLVDPVTDLPNRFAFIARLTRVMEPNPGEKHPPVPFTIILLRIDDLEELNRMLGRERWNQVVVAMSRQLASLLTSEEYLARWSEESLTVLCPGRESAAALLLANGLHSTLSRERYEWGDALVTLRLGCAVVPWSSGMTAEGLVGVAEQTAKAALEQGSQPVRLIEPRA